MNRVVIDSHPGIEKDYISLIKANKRDLFVLSPIIAVLLITDYREYKNRIAGDKNKARRLLAEAEFSSYLSALIAYHVQISTWFYLIRNVNSEKTADIVYDIFNSHSKIFDPLFPIRLVI